MKMPRRHGLGGAVAIGASVFLLLGCRQVAQTPVEAPQAAIEVVAAPEPTLAAAPVLATSATLSGQATWYRWHVGEAAAGPRLRQALGSHWRGQSVTVCAGSCVRVKLTDWCACNPPSRLIDLDARSFAQLAPLSAGVVDITVKIGESFEPLPTAPGTDIR